MSDKTKRDIAEAINRLEPTTAAHMFYVPLQDSEKKVIAFHVEDASLNRPFCHKGRPYMRVESVTTTMPQTTYNELLLQRDGARYRWEQFGNNDLTLQDIDGNEVLKTVSWVLNVVVCRKIREMTFLSSWKNSNLCGMEY